MGEGDGETMPQKTFYVKEDDQDIFDELEEAIRKGWVQEESISGVIVTALRWYLQDLKEKRKGFREEELEVGDENEPDTIKKIIFTGKKLASLDRMNQEEGRSWSLYQCKKDNFLLHVTEKTVPQGIGNSYYQVFSSLEEVNGVPDTLMEKAKKQLQDEKIIYLDV